MPYLVVAVVLVGLLGLVNLLFCFGVIRRLREHTEILNRLAGAASDVMLPPGEVIADFAAETVDGEPVSRDRLAGPTLVGFFSLDCTACRERLPQFVAHAQDHPGGRGRVLAVVVGHDGDAAAPLVAELAGTARVVRDNDNGAVPKAFGVRGYPAFALIEPGGTVRASGFELSALSASARA